MRGGEGVQTITLKIDGMSCGHCVAAVDQAVAGVAGVSDKKVEIGSATVTYDETVTTPEKIKAAITEEGYEVVG